MAKRARKPRGKPAAWPVYMDQSLKSMELVAIADVKVDPDNTRAHDDANIEAIERSITKYKLQTPIVIDAGGTLRKGHGTLIAMQRLGFDRVAVLRSTLDGTHARGYSIADNRTSDLSAFDPDKLQREVERILADKDSGIDIESLGFSRSDYLELLAENKKPSSTFGNPDDQVELDETKVAITKRGDLFELGSHRLLCGDSTSPEDVRRLMDGHRASLFSTDPPYLVGYDGNNHPSSKKRKAKDPNSGNKDWSDSYAVTWDDADENSELFDKFIGVAIEEAIMKNAAWYCWHASRRQAMLEAVWVKHGAFVHQQIIWAKDRPILTRSHYMWQHEPCFMGWVRPNKPKTFEKKHLSSVWQIATVPCGQSNEHPTQKPIEVFTIPMQQHSRPGDVCYEPFCGSGSQIIAAETVGRRCFGMEISPVYCDAIIRRYMKVFGPGAVSKAIAKRYAVDETGKPSGRRKRKST